MDGHIVVVKDAHSNKTFVSVEGSSYIPVPRIGEGVFLKGKPIGTVLAVRHDFSEDEIISIVYVTKGDKQ